MMTPSPSHGNHPETIPSIEVPLGDNGTGLPNPSHSPDGSYVKLAMRNMVKKRGKSLQHFLLTTTALVGLLVGLSYLTR
ncbi:MAG: DUF3285 domain-containing protein [Cyanobacteria bacterium LVE1205-1]|jgi:hypothetical protein